MDELNKIYDDYKLINVKLSELDTISKQEKLSFVKLTDTLEEIASIKDILENSNNKIEQLKVTSSELVK